MTALPPFQALLDEHAPTCWASCAARSGRDDAEDCFQETFLAALRGYPKLSDARNLRGWLLTIAHRKAIDHHRAKGAGRCRSPRSPEVAVEDPRAAARTAIWQLVGALPPKQRAAVALRFASDMPHGEIGAALGCSPEAARRNLHEGMKRLREELA